MRLLTVFHIVTDLTDAVLFLETCGFHVKGVSLDGADENEATTKLLCTLSLRDVLGVADLPAGLLDADLDFKVAWL